MLIERRLIGSEISNALLIIVLHCLLEFDFSVIVCKAITKC
jgi:hypothetical protein